MTARRLRRPLATVFAIAALAFASGAVLAAATPDPISAEVLEDVSGQTITLTATSDNPAATSATIAITAGPSHGSLTEGTSASMTCTTGSCTGDVHYTPDADFFGGDSFSYTVDDGDGPSTPADVTITVDNVNDVPSFTAGGDVTVLEDSGAYGASWASSISAGPNESGQTVDFILSTDTDPSLFSVAPAVASDGTLTFTPAGNANGSATIGFELHDNGGTANGGVDTSAEQTFTLTITPVNDPPTFSHASGPTVLEDSGAYSAGWATSISAGPADEQATQTVTFAVTSNDNSGLFSAGPAVASDGTLTFTPAANANGVAHMTVTAQDDGGTANGGVDASSGVSLTITVTAVNDAPTFTDAGNVTVLEDSGAHTGTGWASSISPGPANEIGQTISFSIASNSNPGLFSAGPAVASNGTLSFTPVGNANGSASVGIVAVDSGGTANGGHNTSSVHTITISVTPVNDPPTFTAGANPTVNQDTGAFSATSWATAMSVGPANEQATQTLLGFTFTTDDNPTLFSVAPAVALNGTLTFTPAAGHTGTANLTLTLRDNGGTANNGADTSAPKSVAIRVNAKPNAVNDTTFVVPENSPGQILDVLANDTSLPDPPEKLTITAVTQGVHGTVTIPVGGGSVTYKPVAGYYGSDFFTYTISDPYGATDTATVFLTIAKDVTAPTVTAPVQRIRGNVTIGLSSVLGYLTWSGSDAGVGILRYDLQRSINGGAYTALTLATPTSISYYTAFTFGSHYVFRVRGVDKNGNVGPWLATASFTPLKYQESSAAIRYIGTWALYYNSLNYGGYTRYTSVAGRYISFTATLRDFAFITPLSSTRGTAYVYANGVRIGTINLLSTTTRYKVVIWTYHWGTRVSRTIQIIVVGTGRIDIDGLSILS